ncbi:MAG: DUF1643 domain-containing protein [Verrucomicrobiae bacterium]|nr:DUF1643 domain-containing protein [Verrucomicrobiae bacterium]
MKLEPPAIPGWFRGFGGVIMTNIFALVTPYPEKLFENSSPVGAENDFYISKNARESHLVVAAWGDGGVHMRRGQEVRKQIPALHCLRKNASGEPSHVRFLRGTLQSAIY